MSQIPKSVTTRYIKSAGGDDTRVNKDASAFLGDKVEEYALEVAKKAITLAKHAGRKTVKRVDIEAAVGDLIP